MLYAGFSPGRLAFRRHLSLAFMKVDEHCIYQTHALVRHVWTNNNGCRHQHVQWVEMVSRILTSRSREGQAKLGGMAACVDKTITGCRHQHVHQLGGGWCLQDFDIAAQGPERQAKFLAVVLAPGRRG